jgi:hypothetical protein
MNIEEIADKLKDVLNQSLFELPYNQSDESDFYSFISEKLDLYLTHIKNSQIEKIIKKINWSEKDFDHIIDRVENLTDKIKSSIELYFCGKVLESTKLMYEGLDQIYFYKDGLSVATIKKIERGHEFYRIRKADKGPFSRKEMFHIPFHKRHLVSTQRYSIPGLPSLYLGDTIFICWGELNKPKIRDFCAIELKNSKALRVIEILRKEDMLNSLEKISIDWHPTILLRYLITFPLVAACSVKTKYSNGAFNAEYIIPQMLLQYITENEEIDGIKYFSTKMNYRQLEEFTTYNYVFPAKSSKEKEFCNILTSAFELTEATSLELEEIKNNKKYQTGIYLGGQSSDKRKFEITVGTFTYYEHTVFRRLERALDLLPISKLK